MVDFVTVCKLYIRIKIRKEIVKEQVNWILTYIYGGLADVWKENILADLKLGNWKFLLAGELLIALKRKFGGIDDKSVKVVELK